MDRLADKVAVITGAASGFGTSAARRFAEEGCRVVLGGPHAYAACKHAVVGLTRNAAAELCRFGIRVNAIAPAGMATAMVANVLTGDPEALERTRSLLAANSPLKDRPGLPDDVANAALWLASDESGYTSGLVLTTDAGTTAGARAGDPAFVAAEPMFREAGRRGL